MYLKKKQLETRSILRKLWRKAFLILLTIKKTQGHFTNHKCHWDKQRKKEPSCHLLLWWQRGVCVLQVEDLMTQDDCVYGALCRMYSSLKSTFEIFRCATECINFLSSDYLTIMTLFGFVTLFSVLLKFSMICYCVFLLLFFQCFVQCCSALHSVRGTGVNTAET